jgi:inner membrane protein
MPTPDNIWGGVRLFFPFEVYIGGWNYIWWWNNYDLFLIILLTATLAIILLYIPHSFRFKKITTSGILCIGIGMYCFQVHQRPVFIFDSTSSQYPKNEANSLLVQQSLLPPYLYQTMKKLDEHLPLYF